MNKDLRAANGMVSLYEMLISIDGCMTQSNQATKMASYPCVCKPRWNLFYRTATISLHKTILQY